MFVANADNYSLFAQWAPETLLSPHSSVSLSEPSKFSLWTNFMLMFEYLLRADCFYRERWGAWGAGRGGAGAGRALGGSRSGLIIYCTSADKANLTHHLFFMLQVTRHVAREHQPGCSRCVWRAVVLTQTSRRNLPLRCAVPAASPLHHRNYSN